MTTDTPEKLSVGELAAMCERDAEVCALITRGASIQGPVVMTALDDRGRLLRHIAAFEAERARPAAPCDREAPGMALWLKLARLFPPDTGSPALRMAIDDAAAHIHALGAASRQEEVDVMRGELYSAREAYAAVKVGRDLCGQLLWETRADLGLATPSDPIDWDDLSEESKERFRALGAGMFGAMREGHARHVARKFEGEIARLTAELVAWGEAAECSAPLTLAIKLDNLAKQITTARAEGAREERASLAKSLARATYQSDNGFGSGDLHELLEGIGGKPFNPDEHEAPPAPSPVEGDTLGQFRARTGRPGIDTGAALSTEWRDGQWTRIRARGQAK